MATGTTVTIRMYNVGFGDAFLVTVAKGKQRWRMVIDCAVVLHKGRILGVAVKSYLPNYREFYEARQFTPASAAVSSTIELAGQKDIPLGADIIFTVSNIKNFNFFLEICEDLWVPIPPSSFAAMAGATGPTDRRWCWSTRPSPISRTASSRSRQMMT